MLITLSGPDPAGTSALAEWLRADLEGARHRAVVLRGNQQVGLSGYLRSLRRRLPARPRPAATAAPDHPADVAPRRLAPGRLVYLLDLLVFLGQRAVVEGLAGHVLIVDRYFYDALADAGGDCERGRPSLLALLTPRPDVPVLLEHAPDERYRRVFRRVFAPLRLSARRLDAGKPFLARVVRRHLHGEADRVS